MNFIIKFNIFITLILLPQYFSLHFVLIEGQPKCFFDDVPKNQVVIGYYEVMDKIGEADDGISLKITDSESKEVFTKVLQGKSKFSFTTQTSGEYKVCFQTTTSSSWFKDNNQIRFSFKFSADESFVGDLNDVAQKKHLTTLQINSKKIQDLSNNFIAIQEMNRETEDKLFEVIIILKENKKISQSVVHTTVFQTIIIFLSGIFQIYSLRKFFIQKKLF